MRVMHTVRLQYAFCGGGAIVHAPPFSLCHLALKWFGNNAGAGCDAIARGEPGSGVVFVGDYSAGAATVVD